MGMTYLNVDVAYLSQEVSLRFDSNFVFTDRLEIGRAHV